MFVKVNNQEEYDLVISKIEKETGLNREHFYYEKNYPIIGKNETNTAICGWVEDCQEVEGYISAEQYLANKTIELRCEIWNTTLIIQTLHCEPFESVSKNGIGLFYEDHTCLGKKCINLGCAEGNCNTVTYHFNTQAEAQSYLDTLLELVDMVNNPVPVVDLKSKSNLYMLSGWSVYVISTVVILQNSVEIEVIKWNKSLLSLQTIKQQLEQILNNLCIKAEVRI